jgi:ribokinase
MPATSSRLLVLGSANVDLCMNLAELPKPGETLGDGTFRQAHGGKGANAAVGAAQAGGNVALVGCVGRDANGDSLLEGLRLKKVSTDFIERHPTAASGVAFIFIDSHAQNMIGVAAGANDEIPPARIEALRAEFRQAAVILVQNEVPEATVTRLLEIALEGKLRVLYNCAPARKIAPRLLTVVEWLIVNETEAAFISGQPVTSRSEAESAARQLVKSGARSVLITLGADGVCVAHGDEVFHVPAFQVKAIDTVAAGDIFCGALAVACAEGQKLAEAVRFASAAAAISVTRAGAQDSAPARDEIEAFLRDRAES